MTREEAIRWLTNEKWKNANNKYKKEWNEAFDLAIEALINVQNMHKGKWIKKQVFNPELDEYVPLIECSVCGYEPYFGGSELKFNYCANCGSRMEK